MNVSKSSVLPLGKSSLPLPDVVLEPIQLTDPAKKIVCFLKAGLLLSSARRQFSRILTSFYKKKKIGHTRAKQEGGVDHSSQAILSCWGTTEGRTHLILNHSTAKIQKSITTDTMHGISKERLLQMTTGLFFIVSKLGFHYQPALVWVHQTTNSVAEFFLGKSIAQQLPRLPLLCFGLVLPLGLWNGAG